MDFFKSALSLLRRFLQGNEEKLRFFKDGKANSFLESRELRFALLEFGFAEAAGDSTDEFTAGLGDDLERSKAANF